MKLLIKSKAKKEGLIKRQGNGWSKENFWNVPYKVKKLIN